LESLMGTSRQVLRLLEGSLVKFEVDPEDVMT
jgi:hypothetical protein